MKDRWLYLFFVIALLGITSCNSSETGVASGRQALPPDVWLKKYNEAWAVCERMVPQTELGTSTFLDPEEDITIISTLLKERSIMVENVVAKEFPALCEYIQIPDYRDLLKKQTQSVYNQIIRQNYLESARVSQEIDTQAVNCIQLLNQEKERMARFLSNYDSPDYIP